MTFRLNASDAWEKAKLFRKIFLHRRIKVCALSKVDVLVYDASQSIEFLHNILHKWNTGTILLRGEQTNFWCLLSAMMRRSFWLDDPMRCYAEQFLKFQKPKIVITSTDNNFGFYQLKLKYPDIKFISVQNGLRDLSDEFFELISKTNDLQCDYFFCFGSGIADIYKKHIKCVAIRHGSIRNNMVAKPITRCPQNALAFVSEWEPPIEDDGIFLSYSNGVDVSWSDFFEPDAYLLNFCVEYSVKNFKKLVIIGRQRDELLSRLERAYYAERITDCSWSFQAPIDFSSSYQVVDTTEVIVGVGSTLLVEALARGGRVAIFNARKFQVYNHRPFDYHTPNLVQGSFWTDKVNATEFFRILSYLNSASETEWEFERSRYTDRVMSFDEGNSRLVQVVSQIMYESI